MWADREEELDGLADADDKPLHLLDFDTPEEFMNAYSRRCDRWRERFDRAKEKVDRKASLHALTAPIRIRLHGPTNENRWARKCPIPTASGITTSPWPRAK